MTLKKYLALTTIFLIISFCGKAEAQEGVGLQFYFPTTGYFSPGVGFGVRLAHHWVVMVNAQIADIPALKEGNGFVSQGTQNIPYEYGASVAYRFRDSNPAFYTFIGYSRFPASVTDRDLNLMHFGIGAAPIKEGLLFQLYPELSVDVPLQTHAILWPEGLSGYAHYVRLPVTGRFTIKLYFDP